MLQYPTSGTQRFCGLVRAAAARIEELALTALEESRPSDDGVQSLWQEVLGTAIAVTGGVNDYEKGFPIEVPRGGAASEDRLG